MKCIVTGGTGFIGNALCRELLAEGDEVCAVIRPDSRRKESLSDLKEKYGERFQLRELGLENLDVLSDIQGDIFFHLAWNGSAGASREDYRIQASNLRYMEIALRAAKQCGCRKFVGAGSQAEYGVVQGKATENSTVPQPFMMYGAAKLAAYHMGRLLAEQLDIGFVWPRIYSVYGVGENGGTLISYLLETLTKGETPQLSPCENMWNFLYITDCTRILAALGKSERSAGLYNVASNDTRLLKDFVEELRDIIAPGAMLAFGKRQADPGRTFWLEPDTARMESIVKMRYIPFAEGIRRLGQTAASGDGL